MEIVRGCRYKYECSGWSELIFETPVGSIKKGLYVLFRFTDEVIQTGFGAGGGPGIGYIKGGGSRGWMSLDGQKWIGVTPNAGFAFEPIMVAAAGGTPMLKNMPNSENDEVPVFETAMLPVTPNPFNPMANIHFSLKDSDNVRIDIYDIKGRRVVELVDQVFSSGEHSVSWQSRDNSGRRVASGVYFARLQVGKQGFIKRMLLVK